MTVKTVLAAPFIPCSFQMTSHRAAQGAIYADLLKSMGLPHIDVAMSTPSVQGDSAIEANKTKDFNVYDHMYMYHGNDWQGQEGINLFGGVRNFPHAYNTRNISRFKGDVYSIHWPMPDYATMLENKIAGYVRKHGTTDGIVKEFLEVDFDNLRAMQSRAKIIEPFGPWQNIVIGDSHAICMYRPGWNVNSVPFKTLHGALNVGLDSFMPKLKTIKNVEFYFGNIDVRHHLCRFDDPIKAVEDLVDRYIDAVDKLQYETKAIYELLPIENERRNIPKSGHYEGTPFFGSQAERNAVRLHFKEYAMKKVQSTSVVFKEWITPVFYNELGEMDFKVMERPKSVHLSREHYPYWQGAEYNNSKKSTLEYFFS